MKKAERAAETEAMFRDVNETVVEHSDPADAVPDILCECSNDACAESIAVSRAEYDRVRSDATHFIVLPEHVSAGIEVVVEKHREYWVIEKIGVAAEIAEETDPRA
jgi:hypothetical protein